MRRPAHRSGCTQPALSLPRLRRCAARPAGHYRQNVANAEQGGSGGRGAVRRVRVRRSVRGDGAARAPGWGADMADKSPRQQMSKKSGKSLKEKRAEKHAKADAKNTTQIVPPAKKR